MTESNKTNPLAAAAASKTEVKAEVTAKTDTSTPSAPDASEIETSGHCYVLPAGASVYVCQDGTRIEANGGIITAWKDIHEAELEAGVACGNFRKIAVSEIPQAVDKSETGSVVA